MAVQSFTVIADVPEGVTPEEFAAHLADAHRAAVRRSHITDPLSGSSEVSVEAILTHGVGLTLVA